MENTTLNLDADLIDIRDIIERYEELESGLLDCFNEQQEIEGDDTTTDKPEDGAFQEWLKTTVHENAAEFAQLRALLEELKGNGGDEKWRGDWYPVTLISEDYFTDYIKEIIDDCYEMPKEMNSGSWPYRHMTIDYEAAAEEAKQDYSEIDIGGTAYLYR